MAVAQLDLNQNVSNQIVALKRKLAPRREALKRAYEEARDHIRRAVDSIRGEVDAGRGVVPELTYRDVQNNTVPEAIRQQIRATGCAVVRGVFRADLAREWFAEVGVMRRLGYKAGIVTGLLLYGLGTFLFWPAAVVGKYGFFLFSLFVIASGLSFLETASNPFIAQSGRPASPAESSPCRRQIAQVRLESG